MKLLGTGLDRLNGRAIRDVREGEHTARATGVARRPKGSDTVKLALRKPSPSMAVSVLALVVATTGTSYAAGLIGSADIRDNSIRSVDVRDGSLKVKDFGGALPAGPQGEVGPQGPAGVGRWALVDETGTIIAQSGGFEAEFAYPTLPNTLTPPMDNSARANGNVYIETNEPLVNNGIFASIALQNTTDVNGDTITNGRAPGADSNPEFSGEISVAMCATQKPATPPATGTVNAVACAPNGGLPNTYLVVSPRNSDGTVTTPTTRKRFYVVVTGDSSDYVAPPAA